MPQHSPFATFTTCRDVLLTIPLYVAGVPTTILANASNINPGDISQFSLEQYQKLKYMYNMYQKYKISHCEYEYIPAVYNWTTTQDAANNTVDQNGPSGQTAYLFNNYGEFMMVPDSNDGITRSTLDEYFQQKLNPNSLQGPIQRRMRLNVVPTIEDVIVNDQAPMSTTATQGTNNGSVNTSPNLFTQADFSTAVVRPMPWIDTHAWNGVTGNGTFYNIDQQAFGIKYYVYIPWNLGLGTPGASAANLGILRRYTHYQFKDIETRLPITNIGFTTDEMTAMVHLRKLKGERDVLLGTGSCEFATPLNRIKRIPEDDQDESLKKKAKTYKERLTEVIETNPSSNAAPLPASQQTPQSHQPRVPVGLYKKA